LGHVVVFNSIGLFCEVYLMPYSQVNAMLEADRYIPKNGLN